MAFETGTLAGGPSSLLDTLAAFLTTNGWTQNLLAADNSGYQTWTGLDNTGKRLHIQKAAADGTVMNFNIRAINRGIPFQDHETSPSYVSGTSRYYSEISGLAINGSTGYSGSNTWDLQPGYSGLGGAGSGSSTGASITGMEANVPAYWLFQNGDTVHVVVEYQASYFMHLVFGCVAKSHVFTGGQFFSAALSAKYAALDLYTRSSGKITNTGLRCLAANDFVARGFGAMYVTVDAVANWRWQGAVGSSATGYYNKLEFAARPQIAGSGSEGCLGQVISNRSPNAFNGMSILMPSYVFGKYASGYRFYAGIVEGTNLINTFNYSPGDEVVIGSDTYVVFPLHTKDPTLMPTTWYQTGFAVKKVV